MQGKPRNDFFDRLPPSPAPEPECLPLTEAELARISDLCDQYLVLREKTQSIYERLTICGRTLGAITGLNASQKERVMAVYATATAELRQCSKHLELCRGKLRSRILRSTALTQEDRQTLLLRIEDGKSIREIARHFSKTDAAVVQRIRRCGAKLTGDKQLARPFYDCASRLKQTKEE